VRSVQRGEAVEQAGPAFPGLAAADRADRHLGARLPLGRVTCTMIRAGRSTTVVHIAGFRATTLTWPVSTEAWKRSGGVTSHLQGPFARPGHFASPNTSVVPECVVIPSGEVQLTGHR